MRLWLGLAAVLLSAACSGHGRTQARLTEYRLEGADTLRIAVDGCRVDATVEDLEETATEVRILIMRDRPRGWFGHSDCADTVLVQLGEPLGSRAVLNARSGVEVPQPGE